MHANNKQAKDNGLTCILFSLVIFCSLITVQYKTRLPHRLVSFFTMVNISSGYKHRDLAIGVKNKEH